MKELCTSKRMFQKVSIVMVVGYCLFAAIFSIRNLSEDESSRRLDVTMDCAISPTMPVAPSDKPVYIASFPGTGARMTWKLVEAITGKQTGDEWNSNGLGKEVIGVNTHWPHPTHGNKLAWGDEIERAIIFIRNPLHVLPVFHNYIYSATVAATQEGGSKEAPEESWLRWRDSNFNQQIYLWRVNIQYWLDKYSAENRLVTPFERLADTVDGPKFANEMNQFLGRQPNQVETENVSTGLVGNPNTVTCMWAKIVDQDGSAIEKYIPRVDRTVEASESRALYRNRNTEEKAPYDRPYTVEQYNQLIVIIRNLRVKYGHETRLDNTLAMYDKVIKEARDKQPMNDLFIY